MNKLMKKSETFISGRADRDHLLQAFICTNKETKVY